MATKSFHKYNELSMVKAIEEVKNGMKISSAAKKSEVLRTTLTYRSQGLYA